MGSIAYITSLTQLMVSLVAGGFIFRVLYIALMGLAAGEELAVILKKSRKIIFAAVLSVCLVSMIDMLKRYYL